MKVRLFINTLRMIFLRSVYLCILNNAINEIKFNRKCISHICEICIL